MTIVRGKDIDLYVKRGLGYVPTACATNLSIEETAEEVNITTVDSGRENEYEGGATDASLSFEGVMTLDELSKWQYEDFVVGNTEQIRVDFVNSYGDALKYEMFVVIISKSAQGDVNDFGSFSISMKRSGAMTSVKTYDNILVDSDGLPILDSDGNLIRI